MDAPIEGPPKIRPGGLADYLEVMTKAVFQSGIRWSVVDAKWPGFVEAFAGFDPGQVAELSPPDVDRLAGDTRIIRNRSKIEATVHNAATILALDEEFRGFRRYLRSHGAFDETVKDLRRRFRFLGEMGAYYFLWVVSEPVPSYEEWCASRGREPHTARPRTSASRGRR
jgi:hypothetical protein